VRSGTKDEAVAATRALCGYRLVNWGPAKPADLVAAGAVHAGGVDYWIRRVSTVGQGHGSRSPGGSPAARQIHCVEIRLTSSEARWQTHRVRDALRGVAAETVE
jgi:hypothetical protein